MIKSLCVFSQCDSCKILYQSFCNRTYPTIEVWYKSFWQVLKQESKQFFLVSRYVNALVISVSFWSKMLEGEGRVKIKLNLRLTASKEARFLQLTGRWQYERIMKGRDSKHLTFLKRYLFCWSGKMALRLEDWDQCREECNHILYNKVYFATLSLNFLGEEI